MCGTPLTEGKGVVPTLGHALPFGQGRATRSHSDEYSYRSVQRCLTGATVGLPNRAPALLDKPAVAPDLSIGD